MELEGVSFTQVKFETGPLVHHSLILPVHGAMGLHYSRISSSLMAKNPG